MLATGPRGVPSVRPEQFEQPTACPVMAYGTVREAPHAYQAKPGGRRLKSRLWAYGHEVRLRGLTRDRSQPAEAGFVAAQ